jgi:hypothetical protein
MVVFMRNMSLAEVRGASTHGKFRMGGVRDPGARPLATCGGLWHKAVVSWQTRPAARAE